MEAHLSSTFSLMAHDRDIDTLRDVVRLAIRHLQTSPVLRMSGTPLSNQAGIKGHDLIRVKNMITELAVALGLGEPDLEPKAPKGNSSADQLADALLKLGSAHV